MVDHTTKILLTAIVLLLAVLLLRPVLATEPVLAQGRPIANEERSLLVTEPGDRTVFFAENGHLHFYRYKEQTGGLIPTDTKP